MRRVWQSPWIRYGILGAFLATPARAWDGISFRCVADQFRVAGTPLGEAQRVVNVTFAAGTLRPYRRLLGHCPSRMVASKLVSQTGRKYYLLRCEPTNARSPIARIKPTANGASVTSRRPEVTCVASVSITGKTRDSKGSSAAQNAHRSPRLSGKMAMRTSAADKLPIASAPASKCLPGRVFMSGWVDRIEYAANPAKA